MIEQLIQNCNWDTVKFLIFSNNVFDPLIYYSHLLPLILSLIIGLFIFLKDRKNLLNQILFFITIVFALWVFFDLILWAHEKINYIMFFWSMQVLIEPLIYAACLYFVYVFIEKRDLKLNKKIIIASLLLPTIILTSTKYALLGFDLTNCDREAIEGPLAIYGYIIEIIYFLLILLVAFWGIKKSNAIFRKQIILITSGIILFLFTFSLGNITGSLSLDWTIAQYGLFGMPIFIAFLAYMIVRFQTFNIKLIGAQALVVSLWFLVLGMLFIRNIENVWIVAACTLALVTILGYLLVRGVKREIEQKEKLEILTGQLQDANEKLKSLDKLKTEFLSLASHQLRSPLTAIKGYTSMLMTGDFGAVNKKQKEAIRRVFESSNHLTKVVEDLLNVSKIEQGGMVYIMSPFDMKKIACDLSSDLSIIAKKKGLNLICENDHKEPYTVNGDMEKIRQVILNLIDNSIKYTKEGSINITLKKDDKTKKILWAVSDTGMGMTPEIKATLFQKFSRGEGGKVNAGGSGLGLYLAKEIVEGHKGRVWVESDGPGKGSTFFVELDSA